MASLSEIHFHYTRAIRQADRLEETSVRLKKDAADEMDELLGETYNAWKSETSEQYLQKGQKVEEELRVIADNLEKISENVRAIAEKIRKTELEAGRIFNEKNV